MILTSVLSIEIVVHLILAQSPPAVPPVAPPRSVAQEAEPPPITTADQLLDALEAANANLKDFQATIRLTKTQALLGSTQVRIGKIFFRVLPESRTRQFAINFTRLILDDGEMAESKQFIFDGTFLVEILPDQKQFFKREVVGKDEDFDPLAVDGPFPLPIGQKKADILRRFSVNLGESPQEGRLKGSYHLTLIPRRKDENEDLSQVDLWYDPATLMPARGEMLHVNQNKSIIELAGIVTNQGLETSLFDTTTPPVEDGWKIDITRLKAKPPRQ